MYRDRLKVFSSVTSNWDRVASIGNSSAPGPEFELSSRYALAPRSPRRRHLVKGQSEPNLSEAGISIGGSDPHTIPEGSNTDVVASLRVVADPENHADTRASAASIGQILTNSMSCYGLSTGVGTRRVVVLPSPT